MKLILGGAQIATNYGVSNKKIVLTKKTLIKFLNLIKKVNL
jgi:hypothetical protein